MADSVDDTGVVVDAVGGDEKGKELFPLLGGDSFLGFELLVEDDVLVDGGDVENDGLDVLLDEFEGA